MSTFTWVPDFPPKKQSQPKVSKIQFGDSYQQRQAQGLNPDLKTWNLSFNTRSHDEAAAIESFLEAQGGVTAFDWVPPFATDPLKFICSKWDRSDDNATFSSITATFEQVAEP